jgi:hypothetical protein
MIPGLPQVDGAELIILFCIIRFSERIPGLAKSPGTDSREFRKGPSEAPTTASSTPRPPTAATSACAISRAPTTRRS